MTEVRSEPEQPCDYEEILLYRERIESGVRIESKSANTEPSKTIIDNNWISNLVIQDDSEDAVTQDVIYEICSFLDLIDFINLQMILSLSLSISLSLSRWCHRPLLDVEKQLQFFTVSQTHLQGLYWERLPAPHIPCCV